MKLIGRQRLVISLTLSALLFVLCSSTEAAQQANKAYRIGYLSALDRATETIRAETIRLALRERGYIDGRNIAIEYRYTQGKIDRTGELLSELLRLEVDVLVVAGGDQWIRAAKNATKTIPIIMVGAGIDPVEAGLVESLARPGGNLTGITLLSKELGAKRLELLMEATPKLAAVAVLYDTGIPSNLIGLEEIQSAARTLRLTLHPWEVRAANSFQKVFAALNKKRPDGLYVLSGPLMNANQKSISDLALKSRLPSVHGNKEMVEAGGLISYGADRTASYQRVAYYVDKILKGAKPGDLPIEQPTKFELVINLKTAKQIGLIIPPNVLARADRIIK